jgi:uncharacterized protein (DUF1501 family)
MKPFYACGSPEHGISRRRFLGSIAAGAAGVFGLGSLVQPLAAKELQQAGKRVMVIWLSGGVSQLETWDPKPGTNTGGPFQAISTSVPGIHICELLPYTAQQMHHLALVRGVNTQEDDHGKGAYIMHTGRRQEPAMEYPHLGAAMAKLLGKEDNPLPGYIHIAPREGAGFNKQDAAFLGPRFASVTLGDGKPPANLSRPAALTESADQLRDGLRARLDQKFTAKHKTSEAEAYTQSFDQAAQLMARRELFDISKEPPCVVDRYGSHDFGRHCLLGRRLLEAGATFVKVTHSNYDTHHENFDFHIEQLGEFDRPFAALLDDLADRGMLDETLVVWTGEMGRTPKVGQSVPGGAGAGRDGRDHWGKVFTSVLAGGGARGGAVYGSSDRFAAEPSANPTPPADLAATVYHLLGVDPRSEIRDRLGRPLTLCDGNVIEPILG